MDVYQYFSSKITLFALQYMNFYLFVMFNCVFVTFPCGILGQVWYLIVLIPDLCRLSYFKSKCCVSFFLKYMRNQF